MTVELMASGYIAQWLERLTADQQVPGSNPGVPSLHSLLLKVEPVQNIGPYTYLVFKAIAKRHFCFDIQR